MGFFTAKAKNIVFTIISSFGVVFISFFGVFLGAGGGGCLFLV